MIDSQDNDGVLLVVDLVDHSMHPAPCGVEPSQLTLQTPADTVLVFDAGAQHELDDRSCGGCHDVRF